MRRMSVVLAVSSALLLPISQASAAAPVQVRFTDPVSFVLPGGQFCAFDVQVDIEQKVKVITFSGKRGAAIGGLSTGKIFAVVTNLETRESHRIAIPGPSFFDVQGNIVLGTGPWLIYEPGQIRYLVGRMRFVPGPLGVHAILLAGREVDYCAVLA